MLKLNSNKLQNNNLFRFGIFLILLFAVFYSLSFASALDSSLVGYWTMDDVSGDNLVDLSINGNDGIISSDVFQSDNGVYGKSLGFSGNGFDSSVDFGDSDILVGEGYTYSFWINPSSVSGVAGIVSKLDSPYDSGILFLQENDNLLIYLADTNPSVYLDSAFVQDSWQHYVVVLDNGEVRVYVNGELMASGVYGNIGTNDFPFLAGMQNSFYDRRFNRRIDDFAIYNKVLSQDEITALYNGAVPSEMGSYSVENIVLIPEFGPLIGTLTIVGALIAFFIIRRK